MRRTIAALLLALTFWSFLAPPLALAADTGWLRLLVHQPGRIDMDGDVLLDLTGRSGRRPVPWTSFTVSIMAVPPGPHRLELRPADARAVPPWETIEMSVAPDETVTVRLGAPLILSSPSGARVLIDGEELGTAPLRINPTTLPGHKVLIEHPGYQRRTVNGDSLLDLSRVSGSARFELDPLTEEKPDELKAPQPTSWIGRHETLALVGSITLLAGGVFAGVTFKNKADDNYVLYRQYGNQERQEHYFNEAQANDRRSLIGWAIGEAAFFATFFLLIHESQRPLVPNPTVPTEPLAGNDANRAGSTGAGPSGAVRTGAGPSGAGRTMAGFSPIAPDGKPGVSLRISHAF